MMKKLLLLLLATAFTVSASAGASSTRPTRIVDNKDVKFKVEKGSTLINKMYKRGSQQTLSTTPLNAMDWNRLAPASHVLRNGNSITWDFEDEDQYLEWTMIDADGDGHCWEYANTEGQTTHSGTGVVSSASYDNETESALTPDNWLISPMVILQGMPAAKTPVLRARHLPCISPSVTPWAPRNSSRSRPTSRLPAR